MATPGVIYWLLFLGSVILAAMVFPDVEWWMAALRGVAIGLICFAIAEFYRLLLHIATRSYRG